MSNHNPKNNVAVLGIDLAKQSFQLHGVDSSGQTVLKKEVNKEKTDRIYRQSPDLYDWHRSLRRLKPLGARI